MDEDTLIPTPPQEPEEQPEGDDLRAFLREAQATPEGFFEAKALGETMRRGCWLADDHDS